MFEFSIFISSLIAQAPLVVVTILAVLLYLERRLDRVDDRLNKIENRLSRVEDSISALIDFNDLLLSIQVSKGILSDVEHKILSTFLTRIRPPYSSKYYTKEIAEKLNQLLHKDLNEYTWEDLFELEKIYEILMKEAEVSGKREYAKYAGKLRVFIAISEKVHHHPKKS